MMITVAVAFDVGSDDFIFGVGEDELSAIDSLKNNIWQDAVILADQSGKDPLEICKCWTILNTYDYDPTEVAPPRELNFELDRAA